MNAKKTGELIVSLRREKGMNQKELADKLEVTNKAVSRWETGGFPQLRNQWAESILVIHCLRI